MPDLELIRGSLSAFADAVEHPLAPFQADALEELTARVTTITAPRQSGKSRSLSLLALHRAYGKPGTKVLVISAGDDAAKRLLAEAQRIATTSDLLRGSVVDEQSALLTLTNGSEIRSVPASEKQVRGWSTDLLLIDEAALVSDELISSAALPTTAARPDARVVMASSATAASGSYYDHVMLGMQGSEHVNSYLWALTDCPWIAPSVIAAARESMSPAKFAAEFEGVFASGEDALFPRHLLDRQTADYVLPGLHGLGDSAGLAGVDWGLSQDRTALVSIGALERPAGIFAVLCAHAWPSGAANDGPGGIIGQIAGLKAKFEQVSMEVNGLGRPYADSLERRLKEHTDYRPQLLHVTTTQDSKSATYSSLRMLLEQGRLVLPTSAPELLRELLLLRVSITQGGGERIEAGVGHDDLADALYIAAGPYQSKKSGRWRSKLGNAAERLAPGTFEPIEGEEPVELVETGAGLAIPREPILTATGSEPKMTAPEWGETPGPSKWAAGGGTDRHAFTSPGEMFGGGRY